MMQLRSVIDTNGDIITVDGILVIHVNNVMYKILEKIAELRSAKEWRKFKRLGQSACRILNNQTRRTSSRKCTSTISWKALQTLISKMENCKKNADFTTVCPESFGETRCDGSAGERKVSAGDGNLTMGSVFRNANPSKMRRSLLQGNKDHLLNQARSDLAKQEKLHVESLNKCIGELQLQTES